MSRSGRFFFAAAALLAAAAFAVTLLAPADLFPGNPRADLGQQFLAWRAFAADSLRHGHLPLWNPFTYSGEPFLAGFQSAVFYPPNLVFLVLPLGRAVGFTLVLHALILGAGLYRWARTRRLHRAAAALGGLVLVWGGPVWPHVYAGHLPNLCSLAWTPWIFRGIEDWRERKEARGLALAAAAVALQLFAGQVQYVFCTAVAVLGWSALSPTRLTADRVQARTTPLQSALGATRSTIAVYAAAALLAAAQLLPGWFASTEGLRQTTLSPDFAGQFSLPPENLLTAVAGGFFGDATTHLYWGRGYAWEMSLYLGMGSALLILVALTVPGYRRRAGLSVATSAFLLLLALGRHTPLFAPLLHYVPGFGRFRGWSKFDYPAFVLLALTAAEGADAVIRQRPIRKLVILIAFAAGLGFGAASLALASAPSRLGPAMTWIHFSRESYLPNGVAADPAVVHAAGLHASASLGLAGLAALLFGLVLALAQVRRLAPLRWTVLAIVALELALFVPSFWGTFRFSDALAPKLHATVAANPGDYRVQNLVEPNSGFLLGAPDIWGNDPALLRRYAEFMAFTQGIAPDRVTQYVDFHTPSPLFGLLRLRYVFTRPDTGYRAAPGEMDRVQLISNYRVLPGRDAVLAALAQPDFDPAGTVILETAPVLAPRTGAIPSAASARVTASTADAFTVEANCPSPTLLLVTDPYSRDWRARALPGSAQGAYAVMPADYALRATPLAAGHHLIEFRYWPRGLTVGIIISVLAWIGWSALSLPRLTVARVPARTRAGVKRVGDNALHP